jgi:LytS/YehU family sensor histidine kinase
MIALAWFGHKSFLTETPFVVSDLTQFVHNPFWIGHSLQTTLVPVALIYFLSHTRLFQMILSGEAILVDQIDFTGVLILIQLLSLGFEISITHMKAFGQTIGVILQSPGYSLLIPIIGGLLCGWKVGLILGLNTWLIRGTYDVLFHVPPFGFHRFEEFSRMLSALSWTDIIYKGYLINIWAVIPVWAGIVAGILGIRSDHHRLSPGFMLFIIVFLYVGGGFLNMAGRGNLSVREWIPATATAGLGLFGMSLIIGNARSTLIQRKAEVAELAAARAELRALRAQINPHFLFNALNTIRYFIRTDPKIARQLLLDLSQILQHSMRSEQFIPLKDELDHVRAYLALEKARFNNRLVIFWDLDVGDYLDYPVPVLILQPVVENAVIHGIGPKPEGGQVHIRIGYIHNCLEFTVDDNGVGIDTTKLNRILLPDSTGNENPSIGLRNVDGRLRALYGNQYALTIHSEVGQGTHVQFTIPVSTVEKG